MARSRRRTRHRMTGTPPGAVYEQRIDVMTYGGVEQAFQLLWDRGWDDVAVVKAAPKPKPTGGGWSLRGSEFAELLKREGIEWPVTIKQTGHVGNQMGCAKINWREKTHTLTIKNYLTSQQAESTLRHEVRHFKQQERIANRTAARRGCWDVEAIRAAWKRTYSAGRTAYNDKPMEVDARAASNENLDLTLTRFSGTPDRPRRFNPQALNRAGR